MAIKNTFPDAGAHWVKQPSMARAVLRHPAAVQAGAGAEFVDMDNPEHASVFFLDGDLHHKKKQKTQRFLSPKAVTDQHFAIMHRITDELLAEFQSKGQMNLEDLSFRLAVEVVGEILGLTNSDQMQRAKRIKRVLESTMVKGKSGLGGILQRAQQAWASYNFFRYDIKPAMIARAKQPKDDAISFYMEEGYSDKAIIIECLTYGTAGMLTTREFIVMAAWYMFEDEVLRARFLTSDVKDQIAILMEILRLEPVAAMIHRRVNQEMESTSEGKLPAGELYGIDIRANNVNEEMVGECPFSVDPGRAKRMKEAGKYLSFGDGPHSCPGWLVALHETRIFLQKFFELPGITLVREPDMTWNSQLKSYELRDAVVNCNTVAGA